MTTCDFLVHGLKNRSTAKKYAYTIGIFMNNFINTDNYDDHSFDAIKGSSHDT